MRYSRTTAVAHAMLIAVSVHAQQTDPHKLKDLLTGDSKGSASSNPQCKLFTPAEIASYVGMPVGPGENAAGGAGCLWYDAGDEVSVTVTVVRPDYFPEPKLVKGFKRLPDVGNRGWMVPDSGWGTRPRCGNRCGDFRQDGERSFGGTVASRGDQTSNEVASPCGDDAQDRFKGENLVSSDQAVMRVSLNQCWLRVRLWGIPRSA